jgi:hypothetical protein
MYQVRRKDYDVAFFGIFFSVQRGAKGWAVGRAVVHEESGVGLRHLHYVYPGPL